MMRNRRRVVLVGAATAAALGVSAVVVGTRLMANASLARGRVTYDAIKPGMKVLEVDKLVRKLSLPCMGGQIGTAMVYHSLDGRYVIAIEYQPDPDGPLPTFPLPHRVPDEWVAKKKHFYELGRGPDGYDAAMVHLGIWPDRIVEVEYVTLPSLAGWPPPPTEANTPAAVGGGKK